jgi:hypothetical protein
MSGEKQGVRETIDRMTKRLVTESRGTMNHEQAQKKSRAAARYVVHGEKYQKRD